MFNVDHHMINESYKALIIYMYFYMSTVYISSLYGASKTWYIKIYIQYELKLLIEHSRHSFGRSVKFNNSNQRK